MKVRRFEIFIIYWIRRLGWKEQNMKGGREQIYSCVEM
jgi:hypothetical protein